MSSYLEDHDQRHYHPVSGCQVCDTRCAASRARDMLTGMKGDLGLLAAQFDVLAENADRRGTVQASHLFRHMSREIGLLLALGLGLADDAGESVRR